MECVSLGLGVPKHAAVGKDWHLPICFHRSSVAVRLPRSVVVWVFALRFNITQKSKHTDIRYHFLRDVVETKTLSFSWVPSSQQLADVLTKFLDRVLFVRLRSCLVGEST